MGNQDRKIIRILADQTYDPPWNCARAAVAVNEKVDTVFGQLFSSLQVFKK
jgi:hypothetical protein